MTPPGTASIPSLGQTRRALTTVAAVSIGLLAGCSYTPSLRDAPAAAGDVSSDVTTDSESTTSTPATSATLPPAALGLPDLLTQDRFVPLAIALERSGLDEVISELDDFVLLAPTGTAFAASGADVGIEYLPLLNSPQLLESILRYHVVADPSTNESWRTLNGAELDIKGSDPVTIERVDGIQVLDQIRVRNGVVLVMPRVLLPAARQTAAAAELQPGG